MKEKVLALDAAAAAALAAALAAWNLVGSACRRTVVMVLVASVDGCG